MSIYALFITSLAMSMHYSLLAYQWVFMHYSLLAYQWIFLHYSLLAYHWVFMHHLADSTGFSMREVPNCQCLRVKVATWREILRFAHRKSQSSQFWYSTSWKPAIQHKWKFLTVTFVHIFSNIEKSQESLFQGRWSRYLTPGQVLRLWRRVEKLVQAQYVWWVGRHFLLTIKVILM